MNLVRRPGTDRAFTLLELIVVVVILGVLAGIAIPTFQAVTDKSRDAATQESLTAYAHEIQAKAALDNAASLTSGNVTSTAPDAQLAAAPGLHALPLAIQVAPSPLLASRDDSTGKAVISYAISSDGTQGALTAISAARHCIALTMTNSGVTAKPVSTNLSSCSAAAYVPGVTAQPTFVPSDPNQPITVAGTNLSQVSISTTAVSLAWGAVPNASGYYLLLSNSPSMANAVKTDVGFTTSYTLPLTPGIPQYITVTPYNPATTGTASNMLQTITVPTPPSLTASVSGVQANLSWAAVPGAANYSVYQDGASSPLATLASGSTSVGITLVNGQTASFTLTASNISGSSTPSNSVTVTIAPSAPTIASSSVTNTTASFAWNTPYGATSFNYGTQDNSGPFSSAAGTVTSINGGPVNTGDNLSAQVNACNAGGCSPFATTTAALTENLGWFLSDGYTSSNFDLSVTTGMRANCPAGSVPYFRIQDDGPANVWNGYTGWFRGQTGGSAASDTVSWNSGANWGRTINVHWQSYCQNTTSGRVSQTYEWDVSVYHPVPAPVNLYDYISSYRHATWGATCPYGTTAHYHWHKYVGNSGGGFTADLPDVTYQDYDNQGQAWGSPGPLDLWAWCVDYTGTGQVGPSSYSRDTF